MGSKLRGLAQWTVATGEGRRNGADPEGERMRGLAARATTPLLPDDYLKLLNPLWSARELRVW